MISKPIILLWSVFCVWASYRHPSLIPFLFVTWALVVVPVSLVGLLFKRT